jgi:hypothetical protein
MAQPICYFKNWYIGFKPLGNLPAVFQTFVTVAESHSMAAVLCESVPAGVAPRGLSIASAGAFWSDVRRRRGLVLLIFDIGKPQAVFYW